MIDSVEFIMLTTTALFFTAVVGTISIEMRLWRLERKLTTLLAGALPPAWHRPQT
jgi:hypothetical protein